jgi:transcriptional regulator with XRE-family HTH domain
MAQNEELRAFLRARRARLRPEDLGVPVVPGQRRVPGLRREELAHLAGVSVDYYVRLEQGRSGNVSEPVLDALARALQLDETERAHLHDLAKPARRRRRTPARPQRVRPGIRLLIDGLDRPAFVVGRRLDVLAANRLARALLADFEAMDPRDRNHARWIFLDPSSRDLYADGWAAVARDNVAVLHRDAGRHPDDEELAALVGELSVKSEDFRRWWAEHGVLQRTHGTKRYHHPIVGELTVDYEALSLPDDPDQTLFVYSVEPGSSSAAALALLGTLAEPVSARQEEGSSPSAGAETGRPS